MSGLDRPLVSLVYACRDVERWLPDLLRSLDRELTDDVEVIFVVDGGTDRTAEVLEEWRASTAHRVQVVRQQGAGPSAARNNGLAHACGVWVSTPDGDDHFGRGYVRTVLDFLRSDAAATTSLVSTNIVPFADATGAVTNDHPLRWKYTRGRRVVRLSEEPDFFQLSGATAFMRLDTIRDAGLSFDARVRPSFEDGRFIAQYLLSQPDPTVAVLPAAKYYYRRRHDQSSLIQTSWSDPDKYDAVLRYGYLATLREAASRGAVPRWLQNTVLYDLSWYFRYDARVHTETAALDAGQVATLHTLLAEILALIDPDAIWEYRSFDMPEQVRAALAAIKGALPARPQVRVRSRDRDQGLTQVSWLAPLTSAGPGEVRFTMDVLPAAPVHAKRRSVTFFARPLFFECLAWLPGLGEVGATADGRDVPVVSNSANGTTLLATFSPNTGKLRALVSAARWGLTLLRHDRRRLISTVANLDLQIRSHQGRPTRLTRLGGRVSRFQGCWLLMDRDTEAHDNAEHLYRYLLNHRQDINAWFVLNKTSPDWPRLAAEGFRLIAHGSIRHARALAQCRELISSQADHYVVSPPAVVWMRVRPWRFSWLGHGVTQLDLSRWLNPKPFSLVVSSTPAEFESFTGDGSSYVWTAHEAALTGQPRWDALVRQAHAVTDDQRTDLVFMPTWRRNLLGDSPLLGGNTREVTDRFWASDYVRNWFGLLDSTAVREAAQTAGLRIVLMAHPNMSRHLTPDRVPDHVTVATYTDNDVQDVLTHASHVVTDYSSVAFDAAMIDRPVMYFQFDRHEFLGGTHIGRPGYFDYERDGFGPVTETLPDAERTLAALIANGLRPAQPYAQRIEETFTLRDGHACERIVAAITARRQPHSRTTKGANGDR